MTELEAAMARPVNENELKIRFEFFCRSMINAARDPEVQADYQQWLNEKRQHEQKDIRGEYDEC